jgi:hypothetical protein
LLEAKDDIKKRGLRSTDMADALCLTFAAPVMPKWRRQGRAVSYSAVDPSYDVFADVAARYGGDRPEYDPFHDLEKLDQF